MSESELVPAREALTTPRFRSRGKSEHSGRERRRMPRPRLAEIKRGAKLKLSRKDVSNYYPERPLPEDLMFGRAEVSESPAATAFRSSLP